MRSTGANEARRRACRNGSSPAADRKPGNRQASGRGQHDSRDYHAVVSNRPLTRLTVNLTPEASRMLSDLAEKLPRGKSKTEAIREAVSLFKFLENPQWSRSQEDELLLVIDGGLVRQIPTGSGSLTAEAPTDSGQPKTGSTFVTVPIRSMPIWANPESMAVAAWLTAFLTLLTLILAVAAQVEDHQAPEPIRVKIQIVCPSNTEPTPRATSTRTAPSPAAKANVILGSTGH